MVEIINVPYFIRDIIVLIISISILILLGLMRKKIKENLSFRYFITAFYFLIVAFIFISIAQVIGVLVRTSLLFYNRYPYLDMRAILLTLGALFLFISSVMFYIPFARNKYRIIKIAVEPSNTFKYGAYWCEKEECYATFVEFAKKMRIPCIAVTRDPPEIFREKLGLKIIPVMWISKVQHEEAIDPTRLPYILDYLKRFLESAEIDKAILIDCIEYLILENGESAVLKFITKLKDFTTLNRGILLVHLDKEVLDEKTYAMLTSELRPLKELLMEIGVLGE